jgi:hypothetical protein
MVLRLKLVVCLPVLISHQFATEHQENLCILEVRLLKYIEEGSEGLMTVLILQHSNIVPYNLTVHRKGRLNSKH